LFEEERVTWRGLIPSAVVQLAVNVVLWVVIPVYVLGLISELLPSSPLPITTTSIIAFGATITGLQFLGALTEGRAVSIPLETGSHIALAYYIYSAVDGGTIALSAAGRSLSLGFQPLLYLMVLPSLFSAVRVPLAYLTDEHEAARPASDSV
jgi:hypothetical protein